MENVKIKYENKNICAECGGRCCKKSGCDYFITDFESMSTAYLEEFLKQGYASIVALLNVDELNGRYIIEPVLTIRARNKNRDIIDLVSMKTECMSLTETGCKFDITKRPSGGSTFMPKENGKCEETVSKLEEVKKFLPYQRTLQRLVKRFTGMSFDAKIKEDVENLIYNILSENFEGVHESEIKEMENFFTILIQAYPEEALKAKKRYNSNQLVIKK